MYAFLGRRATLTVAAALFATMSAVATAQDTGERSFAGAATSSVRVAAATAWHTAQEISAAALDLIGIRYKWGGSEPETGLDCSGLVGYVFRQVTGITLPRTAKDMSRLGDKVAVGDLAPGDLVFFNTRRFAYSHVVPAPRAPPGKPSDHDIEDRDIRQCHHPRAQRGAQPAHAAPLIGAAIRQAVRDCGGG